MMSILEKTSLVVASLMIAGSASASMISFDSVGDSGTIFYGGNIEQTEVEGLTASTSFTLTEIKTSSFVFDIVLANTTSSLWEESRVSRIGFNVDANVTSVTASSPWVALLGGSFPNQFGAMDICVQGQSQGSCNGGPGGVENGDSASFSLELGFASLPGAVTLDNFGVRWQSLNSEALGYDDASGTGTPVTKVPEPGTLGLLGLGVLGLVVSGRRRRLQS
tara:strand:+ start:478 stop:1140 length:663 start_codon:yes stop_codon:yes gene_type:complete